MWIVLRILKWGDFEVKPGSAFSMLPVGIDPGNMIGYCPVYETREAALADWPDGPLGMVDYIKEEVKEFSQRFPLPY